MKSKSLRGSLLLLLTAAIWGAAFVAQRVGMDCLGPLTFNGTRMVLAGLALLPVIRLTGRSRKAKIAETGPSRNEQPAGNAAPDQKALMTGGLLCGLFLFISSTLQQFGLMTTTAGKAGFITALYVVLVPLIAWVLMKKNPGRWIWVSVLLAVSGLFLICVPAGQDFSLNRGDLLVIGCAVCFTGHILVVDHYSPRVDGLRLSCIQFFVCGLLSLIPAFFTEEITLSGLRNALIPILYAGVFSGAVGYTLQIFAQRDTNPTVASLLMCLEAVFAVLTGALLLGEQMTVRESVGCVVMFAAVILAQLSPLLYRGSVRE